MGRGLCWPRALSHLGCLPHSPMTHVRDNLRVGLAVLSLGREPTGAPCPQSSPDTWAHLDRDQGDSAVILQGSEPQGLGSNSSQSSLAVWL